MTGVVWDLGNVLIEWEPVRAIAAGVGEEQARRFLAEFDFAAWNHSCDAGRTWPEALAELDATHPEFSAHGRAYHEHFAASLTGEVPGTVDIVRELHAAGVPQCGLTNWSDELYHANAPQRFAFLALLEVVVVSGTEGIAKPDPRIYALAARRCGIPSAELVFVDDKAENVAAAQACGMHGLVFHDAATLRADLARLGLPLH
ncbi:HAD family phosphatase [Nocardioides sp. zg-536]|uniref:HAD family phosphatase n=1 Tax=Nocardioides faecalis TaxID=2803858 RepID=A0A938Y5T2_9ACTN|nr:HAD family phosphatase [Nocardioides faecalis]MBM9459757.1 HAD family phosphatase [Nocardioides faecalis]MBS4753466.1 HAD family phosphatase [Nocardioides faecalis]QVI60703.1 HAD family phosphatase [Nocardioides faecalis]